MANPEHVRILKQGVEVWNRWWEENINERPELSGADLSNRYLNQANLRGADLSDSNLSRAELRFSFLCDANLKGADLSSTFLDDADLTGADLYNANLKRAFLRKTNLRAVNLNGANLSKAFLHDTILVSIDLRRARGLDVLYHAGPSIIGIDTIKLSEGHIPAGFLRGCGLQEWEIEQVKLYQPDLTPNQINDIVYKIHNLRAEGLMNFYSCFISYSHANKSFARRLHDRLQARGIRCWLDEHQLLPGDDMHDRIDRGIRLWDKVLLCCSESSLTSWWVDKEMDRAIQKEERLWKERGEKVLALIPLDLDGYLFEGWEGGKKSMVTCRLAADFKGWESDNDTFEKGFERIVKALRVDEGARETPPEPKL